ncbi:MAG: DUF3737 family protein [Muribaculaceae bacterium]|nr:DUF3737 family protein [Muribaculaceae bacterium]
METIKDVELGGERPLFEKHNLRIVNVTIVDGESGIKQCSDIEASDCKFIGKYPFWHVDRSLIEKCYFAPGSRSAIWYSNDMLMRDTVIDAPKLFREMRNLTLENVDINDADETFWNIDGLSISNVKLHDGTYPFMGSRNIKVDGLVSDSKYVFQYVKDAVIRNAKIDTKDAFWETENITIINSELNGEYLGWHSKNLRLINCRITGTQPLCYAQNLVLENCTMGDGADLAFEYSTVEATIVGHVHSIKNPTSGHISVGSVGEIIIDKNVRKPADCAIETGYGNDL